MLTWTRTMLVAVILLAANAAMALERLPLDENGWTVFAESVDTQVIYVSSSLGSDTNSGLTENAPVKTLAKGYALLRTGYPDWMLLRRGDEWNEAFPSWKKSGRSGFEPIRLGAYGEGPRPKITMNNIPLKLYSDKATNAIRNLAITGIEFHPYKRDPHHPDYDTTATCTPIRVLGPNENFLFEDMKISFGGTNIIFERWGEGSTSNLVIRRCVIVDAYSTTGHSQGIYTRSIQDLLIEENIFDHNGWNESIPEANATVYNHNVYAKECVRTIIRNNIFSRGAASGTKISSDVTHGFDDFVIENNFFIRNNGPIGLNNSTGFEEYCHYKFVIVDNVIAENRSTSGAGYGIWIVSGEQGIVNRNLFLYRNPGCSWPAIHFGNKPQKDVLISENLFYEWSGKVLPNPPSDPSIFQNVVVENNTVNPAAAELVDPTRSVATYHQSIGGAADFDAFMNEARMQSASNWRTAYTALPLVNYYKDGYRLRGPQNNLPPIVNVDDDVDVAYPQPATLAATVTDDGMPAATLTIAWSKVSGPGSVVFGAPDKAQTSATFSAPGVYVLRITASDTEHTVSGEVTVTVTIPSTFGDDAFFGSLASLDMLNPERWSVVFDEGGLRLAINNGNYVELSGSRLGEYALFKDRTYSNFSMTMKAKSVENLATNPYADYALVFNFVDANNYCYMMFNSRSDFNQLFKVAGGVRQLVADATFEGIRDNNYHDIRLDKIGSRVKVYYDGVQILETENALLSGAGRVGVGSFNDAAYFDDIAVVAIENLAPTVEAGADFAVTLPNPAVLVGVVEDDGLPTGALTVSWTLVSGPGEVKFGSPDQPITKVQFAKAGVYVFRLTADDGEFSVSDEITVTVEPEPDTVPPVITLQTVRISGTVADAASGVRELRVNGVTVPVAADGSWTAQVPAGSVSVTIQATDNSGNVSSKVVNIGVQ